MCARNQILLNNTHAFLQKLDHFEKEEEREDVTLWGVLGLFIVCFFSFLYGLLVVFVRPVVDLETGRRSEGKQKKKKGSQVGEECV